MVIAGIALFTETETSCALNHAAYYGRRLIDTRIIIFVVKSTITSVSIILLKYDE